MYHWLLDAGGTAWIVRLPPKPSEGGQPQAEPPRVVATAGRGEGAQSQFAWSAAATRFPGGVIALPCEAGGILLGPVLAGTRGRATALVGGNPGNARIPLNTEGGDCAAVAAGTDALPDRGAWELVLFVGTTLTAALGTVSIGVARGEREAFGGTILLVGGVDGAAWKCGVVSATWAGECGIVC